MVNIPPSYNEHVWLFSFAPRGALETLPVAYDSYPPENSLQSLILVQPLDSTLPFKKVL